MTTATTPEAVVPAAPGKTGAPSKVMIYAVAALIVGGAVGFFIVAPRLRGGPKPTPVAETKDEKQEPPRIVRLENVIVNPAGTQGQRFLIVSVAVEVSTPAAEERLKRAEVPFRDAVTGLLSAMTLPQLTDAGARETVRQSVIGFARKFAADSALQVYLPQFLIQ